MRRADPRFRPNPNRAVYVQGTIDQALVDTLTPRILGLQHQDHEPITVYVDSRGGGTASAELILRLLRATDQDGSAPVWIVTVATGRAASAAADLLSAGDYALAYPETILHLHGVRYSFDDPLTMEAASFMADSLKVGNDHYAFTLARRCIARFILRFLTLRPEFEAARTRFEQQHGEQLDDLGCLFIALSDIVSSPKTTRIIKQAFSRYNRYQQLLAAVGASVGNDPNSGGSRRLAETEAAILQAILTFEVSTNTEPGWSFKEQGLRQLQDDFLLLGEYLGRQQNQPLADLCERWGDFFLTEIDQAEIQQQPEQERDKERLERLRVALRPIWFFFVALCHALQEGENELSAHDAYWLGLIDEIIGDDSLPCTRMFVEFDPENHSDQTTV